MKVKLRWNIINTKLIEFFEKNVEEIMKNI